MKADSRDGHAKFNFVEQTYQLQIMDNLKEKIPRKKADVIRLMRSKKILEREIKELIAENMYQTRKSISNLKSKKEEFKQFFQTESASHQGRRDSIENCRTLIENLKKSVIDKEQENLAIEISASGNIKQIEKYKECKESIRSGIDELDSVETEEIVEYENKIKEIVRHYTTNLARIKRSLHGKLMDHINNFRSDIISQQSPAMRRGFMEKDELRLVMANNVLMLNTVMQETDDNYSCITKTKTKLKAARENGRKLIQTFMNQEEEINHLKQLQKDLSKQIASKEVLIKQKNSFKADLEAVEDEIKTENEICADTNTQIVAMENTHHELISFRARKLIWAQKLEKLRLTTLHSIDNFKQVESRSGVGKETEEMLVELLGNIISNIRELLKGKMPEDSEITKTFLSGLLGKLSADVQLAIGPLYFRPAVSRMTIEPMIEGRDSGRDSKTIQTKKQSMGAELSFLPPLRTSRGSNVTDKPLTFPMAPKVMHPVKKTILSRPVYREEPARMYILGSKACKKSHLA